MCGSTDLLSARRAFVRADPLSERRGAASLMRRWAAAGDSRLATTSGALLFAKNARNTDARARGAVRVSVNTARSERGPARWAWARRELTLLARSAETPFRERSLLRARFFFFAWAPRCVGDRRGLEEGSTIDIPRLSLSPLRSSYIELLYSYSLPSRARSKKPGETLHSKKPPFLQIGLHCSCAKDGVFARKTAMPSSAR